MAKIRTRARAVDMLGRQQIAGIQNALSELFKNAHDAYAHQACVDYFEDLGSDSQGFIVVRDDGIGMTHQDFEEKWLVLGTESKMGAARDQQYRPSNMQPRPVTGEKGIGRLAIALLGRQVLVLTRAIREDGLHDLVIALIHWGLFELPGLNLEEIEIPISIFEGGMLPKPRDVAKLREQLSACVRKISNEHPELTVDDLVTEIEQFVPDPVAMDSFFCSRDADSISLKNGGTGTHFMIGPSNPVIKIEIASEARKDDYSFRKQLLGFSDQTFGSNSTDTIHTSFRRWLPGDLNGDDFLEASTFFTKDELISKSDHLLLGSVDEFGQFKGSLQIYDNKYESLIIPWNENNGRPTKCGPFTMTFGYIMGRPTESKLPPEVYEVSWQ